MRSVVDETSLCGARLYRKVEDILTDVWCGSDQSPRFVIMRERLRFTALGSCMMCQPFLYQHRGVNGMS